MFLNTISNSKSDVIDQCLKKYQFKYIENLPGFPAKNQDSLNLGSFVHKIYELGVNCTTKEELVQIAEQEQTKYNISYRQKKQAEVCIDNFLSFNKKLGKTIATEFVFEVDLDAENQIKFNGVIDRVIEGKNGGLLIIDYKTSKVEKTRADLFMDGQLKGYAYAAHHLYKKEYSQITCAHYYPITDNLVTIQFPAAAINKWRVDTINRVWKIRKKKADEFYPTRNKFCDFCQYQPLCPEFASHKDICERMDEQMKLKEQRKLEKQASQKDVEAQLQSPKSPEEIPKEQKQ